MSLSVTKFLLYSFKMSTSESETTQLAALYTGPDFEEYCIREGRYLSARRDRSACLTCPLGDLCEAGFEEQKRRVVTGENPSLTEGCAFNSDSLEPHRLLEGLRDEQRDFVLTHVPLLKDQYSAKKTI